MSIQLLANSAKTFHGVAEITDSSAKESFVLYTLHRTCDLLKSQKESVGMNLNMNPINHCFINSNRTSRTLLC
jgi:hypothetical protein